MTRRDFPGAPLKAYVCEEGWLVIGEEAWTPHEWRSHLYGGRPIKYPDDERRTKDRERKRLYYARRRAEAA